MIDDATIERVREAADIVQIVGEHTRLRRMGRSWRGPCPIHGGKNPNFSVSPDKGFYHCFTCGESGDVFTFLEKVSGMDFLTAVRAVAERFGVEVVESSARGEDRDRREPLWETIGAAAEFFTRMLWDDASGAAARDYLESRGITREVADRFALGYAPRGGALQSHLNALGYDDARLQEVGLLSVKEGQESAYARFRDRLTIPIHDASGRPVGFGARLMGESEGAAKYLNSPETPLFAKRRLLYNMHQAKSAIRREDRALVVEGYFDVIRLAAAGVQTAVAGLGTALTETHAETLARLTKNVFLLYDSDEAGQKATFRAGLELLRQGVSARVVTLTDGEDPDTFVRKYGAERLESSLNGAIDLFDRQVQILERRGWFADLHRRRRAIDKLLPTIRATADPITKDIYTTRLAEAAGVDKSLVAAEVAAPERGPRGGATSPSDGAPRAGESGAREDGGYPARERNGPPPNDVPFPNDGSPGFRKPWTPGGRSGKPGRRADDGWKSDVRTLRAKTVHPEERTLILVMLQDRAQVEAIVERFGPESFRHRRYREIFSALLNVGAHATPEELASVLDPASIAELEELMERTSELGDPKRALEDSLTRLRVREIDARMSEIDAQTAGAPDELQSALLAEKLRLREEKKALGGNTWKGFGPRGGRAPGR